MPQLDHVTYFSQAFWLTVFFLSFYVVLVKTLLPKVSTIIKLRKRLTDPRNEVEASFSLENHAKISYYDRVLMNSLTESRKLISSTSESTQKWQNDTVKFINQNILSTSQNQYVDAVGQIIAKKYILKSLLDESK